MTILEDNNIKETVNSETIKSAAAPPTPSPSLSPPSPTNSFQSLFASNSAAAMISAANGSTGDRYITPEYLAPLPSTDKNGKSPLQMLAQTCSQIGADSGSNKLLAEKMNGRGSVSPKGSLPSASSTTNGTVPTNNNSLKRKSVSPALIVADHKTPRTSPPSSRGTSSAVNFKPYETSPEKKKSGSSVISLSPPLATAPSPKSDKRGNKSPPQHKSHKVEQIKSSDHHSSFSRLTDHHHTTNPAFRPPFGNAGLSGYPPSTLAASLAAAAASTAAGGLTVCRDPYCRDPNCPTAAYNTHMASITSGLGSSYAELLKAHQMAAAAMAAMSASTTASTTTASASAAVAAAAAAAKETPYICNWMNGREGYCGKRHTTAEELLQHLRTHTNLTTTDSAAAMMSSALYPHHPFHSAAAAAAAMTAGPGNSSSGASLLHRSFNSLSRYHPYGGAGTGAAKTGSLGSGAAASTAQLTGLTPSLAGMAGLGGSPAGLPMSGMGASTLAGLAGAYSPLYALYGSRLNGTSSLLP